MKSAPGIPAPSTRRLEILLPASLPCNGKPPAPVVLSIGSPLRTTFAAHSSHNDPCNLRPPDQDPPHEFPGLPQLAEEFRKTDPTPAPDSGVAARYQTPGDTRTRLPRTEIHSATRSSGRRF